MFKSNSAIALLFSVTLAFTACSNDNSNTANVLQDSLPAQSASINPDSLLVPGDAAGKIKIDASTEEVIKIYGKPDSSDAAMQKMVAFWFDKQDGIRYSTAIFAAHSTEELSPAKVRQIRISAPAFKTQNGLGVSSTLDDIKKAYNVQEIKYPLTPSQELHVWTDKKGIGFEIGADQRCSAVIIYKMGEELSPTYLPLR